MRKLLFAILILSWLICPAITFASDVTRVLITVDVESYAKGNPDKQIWGKQPDGEHGIRRIMDMLDAHGLKATFYLNVYEAAKFGDAELANIARTIHERGHDLELHTHPGPMFGSDVMRKADLDKQTQILKRGIDLIHQWTGKWVVAHRAGAFDANLDTLKACHAVGLMIDHSLSPVAANTKLAQELPATNLPRVHNGVIELPITFYTQVKIGSFRSLRYLDVDGSSYDELVNVIRQFRDAKFPVVTIMMHSFSFVRFGTADRDVERRFDRLLAFLAAEPGVKVVTVGQLQPEWIKQVPMLEHGPTYLRATEEIGKGWKNTVVVLVPLALLLIFAVAIVLAYRRRSRKRG
jgi:peptidoglycan/xylan/chitin deacetylase (PgdA/CDA1 family)